VLVAVESRGDRARRRRSRARCPRAEPPSASSSRSDRPTTSRSSRRWPAGAACASRTARRRTTRWCSRSAQRATEVRAAAPASRPSVSPVRRRCWRAGGEGHRPYVPSWWPLRPVGDAGARHVVSRARRVRGPLPTPAGRATRSCPVRPDSASRAGRRRSRRLAPRPHALDTVRCARCATADARLPASGHAGRGPSSRGARLAVRRRDPRFRARARDGREQPVPLALAAATTEIDARGLRGPLVLRLAGWAAGRRDSRRGRSDGGPRAHRRGDPRRPSSGGGAPGRARAAPDRHRHQRPDLPGARPARAHDRDRRRRPVPQGIPGRDRAARPAPQRRARGGGRGRRAAAAPRAARARGCSPLSITLGEAYRIGSRRGGASGPRLLRRRLRAAGGGPPLLARTRLDREGRLRARATGGGADRPARGHRVFAADG
jgi:hypothetical protein